LLLCGPFLSIRSLDHFLQCIPVMGPYGHADGNRHLDRLLHYAEDLGCYVLTDLLTKGGGLVERAVREKNDKLLAAVTVGGAPVQAEARNQSLKIGQECSVDHGLRESGIELLEVINVRKITPTE
jgi:hypothetical protein